MRLLVVLSRMPYPLEKGDKLRAYHLVKRLAKHHEVYLFCLSDQRIKEEHLDHLRTFCAHIRVVHLPLWRILLRMVGALFSRLPFQVGYFHHRHAHRAIDQVIEGFRPEHVLCQLVRTTEYVRHRHGLPKTLDYMDTLSKGMERRAETAPAWLRPLLRMETRRLIVYENLMLDLFDHHAIISAQDRDLLYHPGREGVEVIPNGVDTGYFTPREAEKKYDLLFTGNMNYPPNIDSVLFLVQKVLPLVHAKRPEVTLLIAGVDPDQRVRELAQRDRQVTVSGWVKDIRDSLCLGPDLRGPHADRNGPAEQVVGGHGHAHALHHQRPGQQRRGRRAGQLHPHRHEPGIRGPHLAAAGRPRGAGTPGRQAAALRETAIRLGRAARAPGPH
jgi:glycosyltransferase involved in cell wall biosynthesis